CYLFISIIPLIFSTSKISSTDIESSTFASISSFVNLCNFVPATVILSPSKFVTSTTSPSVVLMLISLLSSSTSIESISAYTATSELRIANIHSLEVTFPISIPGVPSGASSAHYPCISSANCCSSCCASFSTFFSKSSFNVSISSFISFKADCASSFSSMLSILLLAASYFSSVSSCLAFSNVCSACFSSFWFSSASSSDASTSSFD